jgi:hypothetical protein
MRALNKRLQWLLIAAAGSASFYAALLWRSADGGTAAGQAEAATRVAVRGDARTASPAALSSTAAASVAHGGLAPPDRRRVVPLSGGDAFNKLSWLPPPPPVAHVAPPKPVAPPAPVAPPLPFTFVGLVEQGTAKPRAFLAKGDALLVVAAGDVIENNTYRLDSLSAQQLVITYLPLNTPQILSIPGASK